MDPIAPKSTDVARRPLTAVAPKKSAIVDPERLPTDGVELAPTPLAQTKEPRHSPAKTQTPPAPPEVPRNTFQNVPQAVLEEPALEISAPSKSLADIAAEVSRPQKPGRTSTLPAPPLDAGRRTGILRRLGHGFLKFLTADPLQPFQRELRAINALDKTVSQLKTPEQFQAKTAEFKQRLAAGETLSDIRVEAYAVARQAASVALGMKPYDCQVLGALAMDDGHIAEMRTGEGKTLTAVMPLYLNALAGKGAHLVTVNDTLAARDAQDMGPAYKLLGMSVGTVFENMRTDEKRQGYAADITYTTDRALGFDYLRDQTAKNPNNKVQREPFFALIDEVDEVLIDEARSPLIISRPGESFQPEYQEFNEIVTSLIPGKDYFLDRKQHSVWLSDTGYARVENKISRRALTGELKTCSDPARRKDIQKELAERDKLSGIITDEQTKFDAYREEKKEKPGFLKRLKGAEWDEEGLEKAKAYYDQAQTKREEAAAALPCYDLFSDEHSHRVRFLYASLKAHALFEAGKDYTVSDGKVEIVDENKGRTSEGRRYNDGVHQAIEAKEGVKVNDDQRTLASITYPNLFKKYPRLSGMSGTAKTSESEFLKLYELDVLPVPTNKPVIRKDESDLVFRTLEEKYDALARDAAKDFFDGKPVLIGTLSVEHNEYVAKLLLERGVPRESMQVLNAETVRGDKEGENEMIGQAGRSGVITVATNLAGRGANIKPDLVNFQKLARTTLEASRKGQPVVVTLNKKSEAEWLQSWLSGSDAQVVPTSDGKAPQPGEIQIRYTKGVTSAASPRWLEGTTLLKGEDFPTGGLTVYGTERSTSRRIDDQLIGRAGRQGAPGRSRFYLSLEDDLLRIFAGSKLDKVLTHFVEPGQGVSNGVLDTLLTQAQASVEGDHFSARESTNKQDEVLNVQRDAFFKLRDDLLAGGNTLTERLNGMVSNAVIDCLRETLPDKENFTYGDIREAVAKASEELKIPLELPFLNPQLKSADNQTMPAENLENEVRDLIERQTGKILRSLRKTTGQAEQAVRPLVLDVVDDCWSEHLEMMENLRLGIGWQALAQKDPEVEFKLQAYDLFGETVAYLDKQVTSGVYKDLLTFSQVVNAHS